MADNIGIFITIKASFNYNYMYVWVVPWATDATRARRDIDTQDLTHSSLLTAIRDNAAAVTGRTKDVRTYLHMWKRRANLETYLRFFMTSATGDNTPIINRKQRCGGKNTPKRYTRIWLINHIHIKYRNPNLWIIMHLLPLTELLYTNH